MTTNEKHLHALVQKMYDVHDYATLDEYGSRIFGRPIKGSWRLFRHITRYAIPGSCAWVRWAWSPDDEIASYSDKGVASLDEFATYMLHEVTHGWCHFLKGEDKHEYDGIHEEQVCWEVSRLVCEVLGIQFQQNKADTSYQFHLCMQRGDIEGASRFLESEPEHCKG